MKRQLRTRSAFTLVELLVVIAIIGVLMALLLPAIFKAQQRSRGTVCLQNIRSLGMAMTLYASDHNGWMPTAGIQHASLVPDLQGYMGEKSRDAGDSAWICPDDRRIAERAKLISFTSNPDDQFFYSYGFVEAFLPSCSTDATCSPIYTLSNHFPIIRSVVRMPSVAIFLADGGWYRIANNGVSFKHQRVQFRHARPSKMDTMEVETRSGLWGTLGYDTKDDFKQARANAMFYDGHAQAISYANYAETLNGYITNGYAARPGMTQIPSSEYR